jgi:hypothetical protein
MSTLPTLDLTTMDRATTWTTANTILYYGPDKITMTFTAATGLLTGMCVDAEKGISVIFGGALLQKQGLVTGNYATGARTGLMVMQAR